MTSLDMADMLAYYKDMKSANIAEFKDHLGKYISLVEDGEEVLLCRRNIPIAKLIPSISRESGNQTKLGCGAGTIIIKSDLTLPAFASDDWEMHQGEL
nr:type II toxin-antitoxin system Phd/YefM family antitoxin [Desulfobulbaceae bacterium]